MSMDVVSLKILAGLITSPPKIDWSRAVARFLLVGGKLGTMLNLSIKVYSKILTRKIIYCKFFNFENFFKFLINMIIILKGFALLKSSCFLYLAVFINIFAKIKNIYFVSYLNKSGKI